MTTPASFSRPMSRRRPESRASKSPRETGGQSETKIEEMKRQKEAVDQLFQEARDDWETERRRLNVEIERRDQQLQVMSTRNEGISTEVVDQLRKQYERPAPGSHPAENPARPATPERKRPAGNGTRTG